MAQPCRITRDNCFKGGVKEAVNIKLEQPNLNLLFGLIMHEVSAS